ncbi:hypothetical protein [Streptomyces indicus]|uniref:hypothetical protein n=1 Tax=Streptomyces indicus TaxID=417292 RepID=UPI00115FA2CA|nr:hypothetical protein [Streptomyces indicus]
MEFELRCDVSSLDLAKSGAIWGNVWVDFSGYPFPEEGWNDMPAAFLVELFDAVSSAGRSKDLRRRVRFFDGPFWIDLTSRNGGLITIAANAHGSNHEVTVSGSDVLRSVTAVCRELVRGCQERGWGEQMDVRRLQLHLP